MLADTGADLDSPQTPGGGEGSPLHYYQPVRVVPGKGIVLTQQNIEVSPVPSQWHFASSCVCLIVCLDSPCELTRPDGPALRPFPGLQVSFGDSCQDVMSSLGPPGDVYFKAEDKMRIHNPASHGMAGGDYLYNYFAHGIVRTRGLASGAHSPRRSRRRR